MIEALLLLLAGLLGCLVASGSEVVLYALPESRVQTLEADGAPAGQALATLRRSPVRLLFMLWLLRVSSIVVAALGAWRLGSGLVGTGPLAPIAMTLLAVLTLALAELGSRIAALRHVERLCLLVAPPLRAVFYLLTPLLWPAEFLALRFAPEAGDGLPRITDRELRDLVSPGNGEPLIEEHERRLIQRAFLLDQTRAYDVMTPRVDIFAWPEDMTLARVAPELRSVRYSRVPLFRENIDDITGILYVRDAYQALISGQRDVELRALAREPFFVPGSLTLEVLLLDFQSRRIQMGLVIDEYGGVDGLVTLEDILEELVGEIVDETDDAEDEIIRLGRNEILVHGGADLREINHFFNTTFPLLEHRSLNGYLLDELGRVPEPGEKVVRESVLIEVLEASDTQVVRARLSRQAPRSETGPEADRSEPDSGDGSEPDERRDRRGEDEDSGYGGPRSEGEAYDLPVPGPSDH